MLVKSSSQIIFDLGWSKGAVDCDHGQSPGHGLNLLHQRAIAFELQISHRKGPLLFCTIALDESRSWRPCARVSVRDRSCMRVTVSVSVSVRLCACVRTWARVCVCAATHRRIRSGSTSHSSECHRCVSSTDRGKSNREPQTRPIRRQGDADGPQCGCSGRCRCGGFLW